MAIANQDTSAFSKVLEFTESLATLYTGLEVTKADRARLDYQAQLAALQYQQTAPTYDARALADYSQSAGLPAITGNRGVLIALGLVGLSVYLIARR